MRLPHVMRPGYEAAFYCYSSIHCAQHCLIPPPYNVLTFNGLISAANLTKQELGSHREVIRDSLSFLGPSTQHGNLHTASQRAG